MRGREWYDRWSTVVLIMFPDLMLVESSMEYIVCTTQYQYLVEAQQVQMNTPKLINSFGSLSYSIFPLSYLSRWSMVDITCPYELLAMVDDLFAMHACFQLYEQTHTLYECDFSSSGGKKEREKSHYGL